MRFQAFATSLLLFSASCLIAQENRALLEKQRPLQEVQAARVPEHLRTSQRRFAEVPPSKRSVDISGRKWRRVVLPPVDSRAFQENSPEQNPRYKLKKERVGIVRPVSSDLLAQGEMLTLGETRIWRLEIESPGATSVRLKVDTSKTPVKSAYVSSLDGETSFLRTSLSHSTLWSDLIGGGVARLELELSSAEHFDPSLLNIELFHLQRDGLFGSSGSCNLDSSCYPDWHPTRSSVGRLTASGGGFIYACSGTLINNGSGDYSPMFLTAAHCLDDGVDLNSVHVDWGYWSSSCNGLGRNFSTGTGMAQMLASSAGSDMALLKLKTSVNPALTWAGWTRDDPAVGTAITAIHHPSADPQKISFGTTRASDARFPSLHHVVFDQGVTEGGSSGSPLFNPQRQVMGTLTGGESSCTVPQGPDFYGRLSQAYAEFSSFLESGIPDDVYEPNDQMAQATPIDPGRYENLVVKIGKDDWFRIRIPARTLLEVITEVNGGLNTAFWAGDGSSLLSQNISGGTFHYATGEQAQDVLFNASVAEGTRTEYLLRMRTFATEPPTISNVHVVATGYQSLLLDSRTDTKGIASVCRGELSRHADFRETVFSESNHIRYGSVGGSMFTFGALLPQTTYYARVSCTNVTGTTVSEVVSGTTQAVPAPDFLSPSNGATGISPRGGLSWGRVSGFSSMPGIGVQGTYDVYVGITPDPPFFTSVSSTDHPSTGFLMARGTTYYWKVVAKYAGSASLSPVISFTTLAHEVQTNVESIDFGSRVVGQQHGSPRQIHYSRPNDGQFGPLVAQVEGEFEITSNSCWSFYDCIIDVQFTPRSFGQKTGRLLITERTPGAPKEVALSGTYADITLRSARASRPSREALTLGAGESMEANVVIDTAGADLGAVQVACSAPIGVTCFIPPRISTGIEPGVVTLKVSNIAERTVRARRLRFPTERRVAVTVTASAHGITRTLSIPITIQR